MFLKHVGKSGDRKVAIIFREVPGEEHMSLVCFPDVMPTHLHDSLMKAIETPEAQAANELGEAIHSKLFPDGRPMLAALHSEGMIKKVRAENIVVTPTPTTSVRLDELNSMLRKINNGTDSALADADANAGITGKVRRKDDFGREIGAPVQNTNTAYVAGSDAAKALDDAALAVNFRAQAAKMEAEARGLLAESARLLKEAAQMSGEPAPVAEGAAPKKRGRPSKQAQVANAS